MANPLISVVIPLYNKEPIIGQSLQSVLSQSFEDFEVIVVDDGSTDGSVSVVESFSDERIHLIRQENGGPSKARNTGTCAARGEWIVFLDADDEFLPDALLVFSNLVLKHGDANIIDCCEYCDNSMTSSTALTSFNGYSKNPYKDLFYRRINPGTNQSIFKRDLCLIHPYDERLRRYEDIEVLMRMFVDVHIYSSTQIVAVVNANYASASKTRNHIDDDFVGHLSFNGSFWQKMCIYQLYLGERLRYPKECKALYPKWYYRFDLLLLYKILMKLPKFIV